MKQPKPGKVKGAPKTRSGAPKVAKVPHAPTIIMINIGRGKGRGNGMGGSPMPGNGPGPMPPRVQSPTAGLVPHRPTVPLARPTPTQPGAMPVKIGPRLSGNPNAHFIGRRPKFR